MIESSRSMISLACQYTPRNSRKSILRDPDGSSESPDGTVMKKSGQRVKWRDDAIEEINVIERLSSESDTDSTDSDHIVAEADIEADIEDVLEDQLAGEAETRLKDEGGCICGVLLAQAMAV